MRWTFALISLLAVPLAARADNAPATGVTAPEVAAALRHAGYPADIVADGDGDPAIRSSTGRLMFNVSLFQCDSELRCAAMEFAAGHESKGVPSATIAAWNRDQHFGRAFLDRNGFARVAMDVDTSGGMTGATLSANINHWIKVLNAFDSFVSL